MNHPKLEQLFRRCDTKGTGYIDQTDFRELCEGFDISRLDADLIFNDLDHDRDGRISFDDFTIGFSEYLTPGTRRGSIQVGLQRQPSLCVEERKLKEMARNQKAAVPAWRHLTANMDKDEMTTMLKSSGDKLFHLYQDMQTSEAPAQLVADYEEVIRALMSDIKKMEEEKRLMADKFSSEREKQTERLKIMEDEVDAQMEKIRLEAKEKAKREYEMERKDLERRMEAEIAHLNSQLKIHEKMNSILNKEKDSSHTKESYAKIEQASEENRRLKGHLLDTQTNIAVLQAELSQMRNQYDHKCSELDNERETKMEYLFEFDNLRRQLELLQNCNQKLQDTNDGLRTMVPDVHCVKSPRLSLRSNQLEFPNLSYPSGSRSPSECGTPPVMSSRARRKRTNRPGRPGGSGSPSEAGGSYYDSDSLRSRCSDRPKLVDIQFGLKRFMEDLDSGHSTLPAEDYRDYRDDSPDNLEYETREALRGLDRAVEAEDDEAGPEVDRSLSEVRADGGDLEVEERLRCEATKGTIVTDHAKPLRPQPAPRRRSTNVLPTIQSPVRPRDLEPTGPPDRTYKVVFAGDAAVGKTSFINRITKGFFVANLASTLGVDFQVKTIRVDERNIALQLWDTAGQERFRSVTRSYFRRADGVMLLYDVTSDRSFLSVRQWIEAVDDVAEKRIPIMLCANKVDLRPGAMEKGRRCVSAAEGERMARDHSAIFLETSSKEGDNVVEALVQLSREMCSSEDVEVQTSALKIRDEGDKKKSCCSGRK